MRNALGLSVVLLASFASVSAQETTAAPEPAHPVESLDLDSHIEWLDDGAVFQDGRRAKRSLTDEEDAFDRAAFLDKAIAKARAEEKLVLWYIPRIIEESSSGVQMYRAPVLDVYMRQVVFCDEDVASIIRHRFVPLRLTMDEALSARFDLRPLEFIEPAVVFLDGNGKVVHFVERLRTFDALWFTHLLRRVLDHAGMGRPAAAATAEEEIARGCYESARAMLARDQDPDVDGLLLRAGLERRLRNPEGAFALLEKAEAKIEAERAELAENEEGGRRGRRRGNPDATKLREAERRVDLERGRLLTLTGKNREALRPLDRAFRDGQAEAGYLLALNRMALGDETEALRLFQLVEQRHPETLFAKRAQANTVLGPDERPLGAAFAGFEHYGYLHDAAYEGLSRDTSWSGNDLTPKEMATLGVRFLLAQQNGDGGFTGARYAYWGSSEITTNTWVAITALSCAALLEYRDELADVLDATRIDDAIARGEAYMFDERHMNRGANEEVYADAFRLLYLSRRIAHAPMMAEWSLEKATGIITVAAGHQAEDGFFAHEYRNAFCTGVMLWALLEAREVGVSVPDAMLTAGSGALESARFANGAYSYGGTARGDEGSLKDASGRMPTCEGVLLRTGAGSDARLAFALETFWEYFDRLERVRRNDFHSDGELAGFFFFHDVFHTSEVLSEMPASLAAPAKARFLQMLRDIPEIDGSFVDSHEFGRAYGTAMALLTLRNVTR